MHHRVPDREKLPSFPVVPAWRKSSEDVNCPSLDSFHIDREHPQVSMEGVIIENTHVYSLDRWRFAGVIGLVILNIAGGLNWPWFSSIVSALCLQLNT